MTRTSGTHSTTKKAFIALMLAIFTCVLGLYFCFVPGPQARGEAYVALAVQGLQDGQYETAASSALMAVRLNPANVTGWKILAAMLERDGQKTAATQAANIVRRLQKNPDAIQPLYAMPAELKLSLISLEVAGAQ